MVVIKVGMLHLLVELSSKIFQTVKRMLRYHYVGVFTWENTQQKNHCVVVQLPNKYPKNASFFSLCNRKVLNPVIKDLCALDSSLLK